MLLLLPDLCKNAKFIMKEKTLKKTIIALKSTFLGKNITFSLYIIQLLLLLYEPLHDPLPVSNTAFLTAAIQLASFSQNSHWAD